MKEFTIIWIESWMSGNRDFQLTKKQFLLANSVQDVMNSRYGDKIVFLFDGWITTIGEVVTQDLIEKI